MPLFLTVTAATVGIAAWIWSERREDDDEETSDGDYHQQQQQQGGYASMSGGVGPQGPQGQGQGPPGGWMGQMSGSQVQAQGGFDVNMQAGGGGQQGMMGPPQQGGFMGPPGMGGPPGPPMQGGFREMQEGGAETTATARSTAVETQQSQQQGETGIVARMSSAMGLGRAASPAAANIDWAGKKVLAGVTAAGAMVGGALGLSGNEEGYEDHERWSEEAEEKDREVKQGIRRRGTADEFYSGSVDVPKRSSVGGRKRRMVALVVSAVDSGPGDQDLGDHAVSPSSQDPAVTHLANII